MKKQFRMHPIDLMGPQDRLPISPIKFDSIGGWELFGILSKIKRDLELSCY